MSYRGLAILKGRRRLHCPSIGGRHNAIWQVQTGPRDPSSSLSLWAPTQSGKQSILGPTSSRHAGGPHCSGFSCHVDMVDRSRLQSQFALVFSGLKPAPVLCITIAWNVSEFFKECLWPTSPQTWVRRVHSQSTAQLCKDHHLQHLFSPLCLFIFLLC